MQCPVCGQDYASGESAADTLDKSLRAAAAKAGVALLK